MGGNAVKNELASKMSSGSYYRISSKALKGVFCEVIDSLVDRIGPFIEDEPDFNIGSTRLASCIVGKEVLLFPSETGEVIEKAKEKKTSYGDLDIGITLKDGYTLTDIGNHLEMLYPDTYTFRPSKMSFNEMILGVKWGEDKIIQIDLVDMSEHRSEILFMQSSSFLDISEGIKGAFHKWFIRSVLSYKKLNKSQKERVQEFIDTDIEVQKWMRIGYVPGKFEDIHLKPGRFQLGKGGVHIVVDLYKRGVKTKKTLKIDQPIIGFDDIHKLSSFILKGTKGDDLISSVKFAQKVKSGKDLIWEDFVRSMSKQKGTLDEEDYNKGMDKLSSILGIHYVP